LSREEAKVGLLASENEDLKKEIEHHEFDIKGLN